MFRGSSLLVVGWDFCYLMNGPWVSRYEPMYLQKPLTVEAALHWCLVSVFSVSVQWNLSHSADGATPIHVAAVARLRPG